MTLVQRTTTLRELAAASAPRQIGGDPDQAISGIEYDSRNVSPGDLFVALRGTYFDGHRFIDDALARGAAGVAAEVPVSEVPCLIYDDTRQSLPRIASAYFDQPAESLTVVGITGTDGKTTTSYMTDAILEFAGCKTGLVGTVSVKIAGQVVEHETRQTTPESLDIQRHLAAMRDAGADVAILEATSHGLAAHRLDEIPFTIGAVTNITHEHLEFHGSIKAYRLAKASLFERVGNAGGHAVINLDDNGSRSVIDHAAGASLITYSLRDHGASVFGHSIECTASESRFAVESEWGSATFRIPFLGEFNVENALCAISIGLVSNVEINTIAEALKHAPQVPGRMVRISAGQPFELIVDYAHTPESLAKILQLLRRLAGGGRLICVSGSAGERDVGKRAMQGRVSAELADLSIFSTEDPRFEDPWEIIDQIAEGARQIDKQEPVNFVRILDRQEAIDFAVGRAKPGDVVLLAGKGHERSIIWGHDKRLWDEADAARSALKRAGYG